MPNEQPLLLFSEGGSGLRIYPVLFGRKIASLMPQLMQNGEGKPRDEDLPVGPAHLAFQNTPWEDWPEANLKEVVTYLRGSKNLAVPKRWKDVLPKSL